MNATWFRRLLRPVLTVLLALGPFSTTFASPPELSIVDVHFTFPIAGCDFPAQGELTVTLKVSVHFDQDGDFKMLIERVLRQQATYTNLQTGASISSSKGGGIDKILVEEDGTVTFLVMGLIDIVPVPGQGLVVQDVGRIIVDTGTGQLLFSAGQFTVHGPGGSVEALCAALA